MITFLFTLGLVGAVMAAMALGSRLVGRPLRGSCGGTGGSCACRESGADPTRCPEAPAEAH